MEVILLEKIRNLGSLGDKVAVRAGYGRNYLIPQGKAVPATAQNLEVFEQRREELEQQLADKLAAAEKRAAALENKVVEIKARAMDEGKLYGSIGVRELVIAMQDAGIEVQKSEVNLPAEGPIRYVGEYEVNLQLHTDVEVNLTVSVVEDK